MVFPNKYFFHCVCLGLVVGIFFEAQDVAADGVMNIAMEDQFQNSCETRAFLGDVVILVYAERHGADKSLQLGRKLHLHFHPTADTVSADAWSQQPVRGIMNWPSGVPCQNPSSDAVETSGWLLMLSMTSANRAMSRRSSLGTNAASS